MTLARLVSDDFEKGFVGRPKPGQRLIGRGGLSGLKLTLDYCLVPWAVKHLEFDCCGIGTAAPGQSIAKRAGDVGSVAACGLAAR